MITTNDYSKIMADKKLFCKTVYTTLSEAKKILEERQKDKKLIEKIEKLLKGNIPEPLKKIGKNGVHFRQVATPNHDARWFIELTKDHGLKTNFFEQHGDKFTNNNEFKHSLGQLRIHKSKNNKKGDNLEEKVTIIDFNKYDGKKIKDIVTLWGETLVGFHKELFGVLGFKREDFVFYDASIWLEKNGSNALDYYSNELLLFVCHGILFENFLLTGSEGEFTKKIFLPALKKVIDSTGVKPLIVPIPPMDNQEDSHWVSYSSKIKPFLLSKINHD